MVDEESTAPSAPNVAEIVQKVRRIQIVASRAVDDLFAGEYQSVFRGRGMEFDEVREYQPGDEVRTIDWNVTARNGTPFVKRYREERELTVIFLVDVTASGAFGSRDRSKLELAVEVAALLMFSALRNNDKVGLVLFGDDVHRYFAPRKGKASVLRLLRELVASRPVAGETRIDRALEFLSRVQRRKAVVFVMSDFLAKDWERPLRVAKGRHDLVAITVADPREEELPPGDFVTLEDAETGERVEVDARHPGVRRAFAERAAQRESQLDEKLRRSGVDRLPIRTDVPYLDSLRRFFRMRERRLR